MNKPKTIADLNMTDTYLITVFENTLYEVHEDNIGIMYDIELAKKFVQEALLKNSSDSEINTYDTAEVDQKTLEIINYSICYTNGNITYTIYVLKEIKESSDLEWKII